MLDLAPGIRIGAGSRLFSPSSLFAASEPGGWYDASDLTTLFQDSAGTTPVTAAGQSVGLWLDKSRQQTFAARINLLNWSEDFSNAAWTKSSTTGSGLQVREVAASAEHFIEQVVNLSGDVTATFELQSVGRDVIRLNLGTSSATYGAVYTFSTNTLSSLGTAIVSATATDLGDGYRRIVLRSNAGAARFRLQMTDGGTNVYLGDITKGLNARNLQLQTGSSATTYQATTTLPTSWLGNHLTQSSASLRPQYNVASGLPFLLFDGSDDFLISPTITPGVNKAQVFAGVRKLSDAATGMVVESSTTINNGTLRIAAPFGVAANYYFESIGTTRSAATGTTFTAPTTNVLTGIGDIAADTSILRVNGTEVASNTADQGTGNYTAQPLYVGRRAGTSVPFNGRIYGLIVRFGANLTAAQIAQAEAWMNQKTGAY